MWVPRVAVAAVLVALVLAAGLYIQNYQFVTQNRMLVRQLIASAEKKSAVAFELYDLERDPDEVNNLADDAGHATIFEELKGKLKAFQERTEDPWILKWDYE